MKKIILILLICLPAFSYAAPIVYNVNRTIGTGSVTGYIQTDGTLGLLSIPNITAWSLTIQDPDINGGVATTGNTGAVAHSTGPNLSATTTDLLFDFDINTVLIFWNDAFTDWWCLAGGPGGNNGCFLSPGESIGYSDTIPNSQAQFTGYTGQVSIATVASSTVPEPGTLAILSLGILGLSLARRKSV